MTKNVAARLARKLARENGTDYLVYHWTDDPCYPGPTDYHVVECNDYYVGSGMWIPEDSVVYGAYEGWYS